MLVLTWYVTMQCILCVYGSMDSLALLQQQCSI
jgi:hypothetical protein